MRNQGKRRLPVSGDGFGCFPSGSQCWLCAPLSVCWSVRHRLSTDSTADFLMSFFDLTVKSTLVVRSDEKQKRFGKGYGKIVVSVEREQTCGVWSH